MTPRLITLTPKQQEVLKTIEDSAHHLGVMWTEWKILFWPPMKHMQLMNDTAPMVFGIYRESVIKDILLTITKLTDPSGRQDNYCLPWLCSQLPSGQVKNDLTAALAALEPKLIQIRKWRNKMIAHHEVGHDIDELLPQVHKDLEALDSVVKEVSVALNIISKKVSTNPIESGTLYHQTTTRKGVNDLIHFLKDGLAAHKVQLEQNKKEQSAISPSTSGN